jgi:hypothetical protein
MLSEWLVSCRFSWLWQFQHKCAEPDFGFWLAEGQRTLDILQENCVGTVSASWCQCLSGPPPWSPKQLDYIMMPLCMTESPQLDQFWGEHTLLPWDLAHWKSCLSWLRPRFRNQLSWPWSCGGFLSLSRQMLGECFKLGDNHFPPISSSSWFSHHPVSDAIQLYSLRYRLCCGHCRAVARYGQQKVRPWLRLWHSIPLIECWWLRPTMNYISGTGVNQFHSQSVTPQIKGRKLGNLLCTELKHVLLMFTCH